MRGREDKVCDAGYRIGEPALFQPQEPAEIRGSLSPARRWNPIRAHPALKIKVRACEATNLNGQYEMQDPNHWYSLQRSNTGQHAYSIQDSASNTPTLPPTGPAGLHDNQAISSVYSLASAVRPTQGEGLQSQSDTNYSPYIPQCPVTFPIYPWSHIRLLMHNPNISARMAVTPLHLILLHTPSMQLS